MLFSGALQVGRPLKFWIGLPARDLNASADGSLGGFESKSRYGERTASDSVSETEQETKTSRALPL